MPLPALSCIEFVYELNKDGDIALHDITASSGDEQHSYILHFVLIVSVGYGTSHLLAIRMKTVKLCLLLLGIE